MRSTRRPSLRIALIAAVLSLLAVPAAGAGASDDLPQVGFLSGDSPLSTDPYPVDVYAANADGTGLTNLTAGYGAGWQWAWSPDGSRIAFVSDDGGVDTLYVRDIDAGEPRAVASGAEAGEGWAWSPDGTRIAYVAVRDGDSDVFVVDVATLATVNVSNDPVGSSGPRWSPAGSHIAFDAGFEDASGFHQDVYIVPATGGHAVNVTDDSALSSGGAWSPDGSRFVFVTIRDGNEEIYVADGDGRNPVRLTTSPAIDLDPAWSPDGTQIAFSSGLDEWSDSAREWQVVIPRRIFVMGADGANRRAVTDGSIDPVSDIPGNRIAQVSPTWSPDGSLLTVAATVQAGGPHGYSFTIYTVNPNGGDPPVEIFSDGGQWSLTWAPDGTKLLVQSFDSHSGLGSTSAIVASDGTGTPVILAVGLGNGSPGWSTYGSHIAYMNGGVTGPGNTVFVAATDGSNPIDITADLDGSVNTAAAWRPQPLGPVGLVDPSTGVWYLRDRWGVIDSFYYGNPGDVPFLGDWNGDGVETPGLYRQSDGYVYLRNSNTQGIADVKFYFGNPGDVPLAGDFDGDGFDTVSIYRPSEQRFYIMNELGESDGGLGAAEYSFLFGNPGDQPVVGDWDGDGADEIGLHRASTGFFYYRTTLTTGIADAEFYFGDPGDRFVAGDWGLVDGRDTPAVFRPSNTVFYFRHTLSQGSADSQFTWPAGNDTWIPVAGRFTD